MKIPENLGWLELWTIACIILCWSPLALNLKVIYTEQLTTAHDAYTALVASVSVATPLSIDLFLDMLSVHYIPSFKARPGTSPRTVLILSLLLPDLLILCVAMPLGSVSIMICLFKIRSVLVLYGVYGHLWRMDIFFRSRIFLISHFLFTGSCVVGVFTGFHPPLHDIDIGNLSDSYGLIATAGVFGTLFVAYKWRNKMKNISFQNMTSNELSASVYMFVLSLIVPAYVISGFIIYETASLLIISVWTYIELCATLVVTALQSRIIQNEIQHKEVS
eukprot:gene3768-7479_t